MNSVDRARIMGTLCLWVAMLVCVPAMGQTTDFSGEWSERSHEDNWDRRGGPCPSPQCGGPALGDYLGFALTDAGRMRADTADASEWGLPEFQCRPHPVPYVWRAAGNVRINKEIDPVSRQLVAYHVNWVRSLDRTIYMDGRPHPPEYAAHTWEGFSTGQWDGNTLVVTTTHLKESYLRRNGVKVTDAATVTEYLTRHGDILTVVAIIEDPVYLAEPWVFSVSYVQDTHTELIFYPCSVVEGVNISPEVPHFLPGANPYLTDWTAQFGIPEEAAKGYRGTLYPEYQMEIEASSSGGGSN